MSQQFGEPRPRPDFESRLTTLRNEAVVHGRIEATGTRAAGGPQPVPPGDIPGYYGLPVLKDPVWKWMIPVYFFVGGVAGMAAVLACVAFWRADLGLARTAMWIAAIGAVLAPVLLTWDLGRPRRFLHMLRVLKLQSPMSVGSWIVAAFGICAIPGLVLLEWHVRRDGAAASDPDALALWVGIVASASAGAGMLLATYTGALLAASVIPAWHLHRVFLPVRFGVSGLGGAVSAVELLGWRGDALHALGIFTTAIGTLLLLWLELHRHGAADRALHEGRPGWALRIAAWGEGPAPLVLRLAGAIPAAAVIFLASILLSRFGWIAAGTSCARDPGALFAAQQGARGSE